MLPSFGVVTTNHSESSNSYLKEFGLSGPLTGISTFISSTNEKLIEGAMQIEQRMKQDNKISEYLENEMRKAKMKFVGGLTFKLSRHTYTASICEKGQSWTTVIVASQQSAQVHSITFYPYASKWSDKIDCICGQFVRNGYPCPHATVAMQFLGNHQSRVFRLKDKRWYAPQWLLIDPAIYCFPTRQPAPVFFEGSCRPDFTCTVAI